MLERFNDVRTFPWRSAAALLLFICAMVGFASGVAVTERPEVAAAGLLTQAYYSLSLFVIGGVDLGTPFGGPLYGRVLLWLAYFGCPILAASTLILALLKAIAPQSLFLRRLRGHVVIFGAGEMSLSYLRVLRHKHPKVPVIVVSRTEPEPSIVDEFEQGLKATFITGDITHEFFLRQLRVKHARKILLLSDNSLRSFEAASHLLDLVPDIGPRMVIHCAQLRFMRAMANTVVAKNCETFNVYHLAASALVRDLLLEHFGETRHRDVVVIAGFGRFGQTVLEELQNRAAGELDTVIIIEKDAHRRVLVAEEQMTFSPEYRREIYEGDISHPAIWQQVQDDIELAGDNKVFVLGTGGEADNLRTALWIRRKYPESMVIARSSKESRFAKQVGEEHNIISISIDQLVESNIPARWIDSE